MFTFVLLFTGLAASAFASPVSTEKRSVDAAENVPYLVGCTGAGRTLLMWCRNHQRILDRFKRLVPYQRCGPICRPRWKHHQRIGGVTRELESIRRFDGFGFPHLNNKNLGIAKLAEPIEFSDTIQPIGLPALTDPTSVGSVATISGWGAYTWLTGPLFNVVQTTQIPIVSDDECVITYSENQVSFDTICAGLPTGGIDGYQGDYGSPLVIDGVLHGLLSLTSNLPGQPRVYAKVSYFRRWIHQFTSV